MAWEQMLHQRNTPFLEGLGKHSMVSVAECLGDNCGPSAGCFANATRLSLTVPSIIPL